MPATGASSRFIVLTVWWLPSTTSFFVLALSSFLSQANCALSIEPCCEPFGLVVSMMTKRTRPSSKV